MSVADDRIRVIAEIGCNHMGQMDKARELVSVAARLCHADVAKFQKRSNRELLPGDEYDKAHPVPRNAYGATYGLHREALEFDLDQHRDLKAHCEAEGIAYATSVWDLTSAKEIASLEPELIKIPSATNLNWAVQEYLCRNFAGAIHVSTGMTTRDEMEEIVRFYERFGRAKDLVLYACTSGYPISFDEICLHEIPRLISLYGERVGTIGFSGHHLGIAADIAAIALGARWVERHFTLDRTWKGTDHAASLEPDGLRRLCRDIQHVSQALRSKEPEILPVEEVQRAKLKSVQA